jgi:hypothetical protein
MNIAALCSQKIVKTTKLVLGPKNSHVNAKIDATYEKIDTIRFTATCSQGVRARVKTSYNPCRLIFVKTVGYRRFFSKPPVTAGFN